MVNLLEIHNGRKIDRKELPDIPFATFQQELLQHADSGGNVVQFFAYVDNGQTKLMAILRNRENDSLYATGCEVGDSFSSLTTG